MTSIRNSVYQKACRTHITAHDRPESAAEKGLEACALPGTRSSMTCGKWSERDQLAGYRPVCSFSRSVVREIPRIFAACDLLLLVALRTLEIYRFSISLRGRFPLPALPPGTAASADKPGREIHPDLQKITSRSTILRKSLIFPGQPCPNIAADAAGVKPWIVFFNSFANRCRK